MTTVIEEINRIRSMDPSGLNESTAKTAMVMPVLRTLGWDTTDPDEVKLEYEVAKHLRGYADIALLSQDTPLILIETKAPNHSLEMTKHKIQVLEYCQMKQVRIGVLTNGLEWRIYYLGEGADRDPAPAKIVHLIKEKPEDSAKTLHELLSRDSVSDKRALTHARQSWHNNILTKLWRNLLAEGDDALVRRLGKEVRERHQAKIPADQIKKDQIKKFIVARADFLDAQEKTEIPSPAVPPQPKDMASLPSKDTDATAPPPKIRKRGAMPVRARMFGTEYEFKSWRDASIGFTLQACHRNPAELQKLMQCLENDKYKRTIMAHGNERPLSFAAPKKIGETAYWLETHPSGKPTRIRCDRIRQALSLPEDVLVWLGRSPATLLQPKDMDSPPPKIGKGGAIPVRAKIFGTEDEFKSYRAAMINFTLQACHRSPAELQKLTQRLENDKHKKTIMAHGNERPPSLRRSKRIEGTAYWLGVNLSREGAKRQCDRIRQALSLPEDVLVWLD